MAVTSMRAVNIIGQIESIDDVVTVLGESGAFHPDDVSNFYGNVRNFAHLQTKNIYAEPLARLKAAIELTKRKFPLVNVSGFNPGYEELKNFSEKVSQDLDVLVDDRNFISEQLIEAKQNLEETSHFLGLGVEIQKVLTLKYISARFGRLPRESYSKLSAYKNNPYVDFTVCTEDKSHYWGVYFAPVNMTDEIDRIFSGLYFEKCDVVGVNETPQKHLAKLKELVPELEEKLNDSQARIDKYLEQYAERIAKYLSKLEELNLYAAISAKALRHGDKFIIVGWVPADIAKPLSSRLKKLDSVSVELTDAKKEMEKSPPVKLKNCFLSRPFEFYTEMYGMPKYNEIDPTMFVAITYIIIFGIMFGDVGHGICLSIVAMFMWKVMKMKIGKILFPCGISSAFFGCVFGSVFGFEHALDPMYKALFGLSEKPIEVMDSGMINTIIFAAIGIGVFLLIVAMCLNVYTAFRQKNYGKGLFSPSGVTGIVFYGSLVFGLVGQLFLGMNVLTLPYILGLIVLPFVLIFFCEPLSKLVNGEPDWQPESWGGYIVENLFESIEVLLSYVTNTMSFLRVGAFVFVHAGMMMVVFILAETVGGVGYWLVVVLGNALVMVLEALLVAIQVLRLEYYEMFSRFYSGEGRPYNPIRLNTDSQ